MRPKPPHLGAAYGAQFQDQTIADAYVHRPPYPDGTFDILMGLLPPGDGTALDLGCGTGDVARPLARRVARLDAVDPSAAMIARGKALPGGDAPNLRWIVGTAEDAPLSPPYALVTAAESMHWMDWPVLFPRLHGLLAPGAVLAILGRDELPPPWAEALGPLITQYSTNREYRPYNLIEELTSRGLFEVAGHAQTQPRPFQQTTAGYVESFHSRNGFSRERMTPDNTAAFDDALTRLVGAYSEDGMVRLQVSAHVWWGRQGG